MYQYDIIIFWQKHPQSILVLKRKKRQKADK